MKSRPAARWRDGSEPVTFRVRIVESVSYAALTFFPNLRF